MRLRKNGETRPSQHCWPLHADSCIARLSPLCRAVSGLAQLGHMWLHSSLPGAHMSRTAACPALQAGGRAPECAAPTLSLTLSSKSPRAACLPGLPPGSIHVPYLSLPRRPPSLSCCCRARGQEGGGAGELDKPSGSSSAAADGPVRMKYRSTLTEENVAYLNKLDQYSSRPDSSGGCWAQLYLKF